MTALDLQSSFYNTDLRARRDKVYEILENGYKELWTNWKDYMDFDATQKHDLNVAIYRFITGDITRIQFLDFLLVSKIIAPRILDTNVIRAFAFQ